MLDRGSAVQRSAVQCSAWWYVALRNSVLVPKSNIFHLLSPVSPIMSHSLPLTPLQSCTRHPIFVAILMSVKKKRLYWLNRQTWGRRKGRREGWMKDRKEGGRERIGDWLILDYMCIMLCFVFPLIPYFLNFLSFLAFVLIWSPIQMQSSALLPDEK